ncbi:hypothetical protein KBZ19_12520 [Synechococcus sp. L2F]|uniref:hypothetical protein n=1 Tax=Synechococcus sp. L2F TaxID=2823739 RepID=UPI0020CE819B|nr:hypothetical protein [Synechococcus sp. L2F]MCP9829310.1 hypothetical protein [Synechococcus sp. L2F]
MYEQLIPAVVDTFSLPGEPEHDFLLRLRAADICLRRNYATSAAVSSEPYAEPILRAAYLLRYLGHYTLQLGDLLKELEGSAAAHVLALPELRLAALCGGPCPEAIALAALHSQAGGRRLQVDALDRHAEAWSDCWPITSAIIRHYPGHPEVRIEGVGTDLLKPSLTPQEHRRLQMAQVFTSMNCLNELVGVDADSLQRGLAMRLDALSPGTLVLASDLAGYSDCAQGLQMLLDLLTARQATVLLAELDPSRPHEMENRFEIPERIAWIYSGEYENRFRIFVRQLRLAAVLN